MIACESAGVLENRFLVPGHFKLILRAPHIAPRVAPGQFIQIRCTASDDPLLPRPMSVYRVGGERMEILYEVVGHGTALMAQAKKGDTLDIYGPLGRPFWKAQEAQKVFLIGGGIGVAPFYALAEMFLKETGGQRQEVAVLFGARTKERVVCEEEFKKLGVAFDVSTDDGSYGFRGRVTELLEKKLSAPASRIPTALYVCGPNVMMREACRIALSHNLPCQVSLDEPMACGFGICFGCAVKTRGDPLTYKLACKDGPVFEAREVVWE